MQYWAVIEAIHVAEWTIFMSTRPTPTPGVFFPVTLHKKTTCGMGVGMESNIIPSFACDASAHGREHAGAERLEKSAGLVLVRMPSASTTKTTPASWGRNATHARHLLCTSEFLLPPAFPKRPFSLPPVNSPGPDDFPFCMQVEESRIEWRNCKPSGVVSCFFCPLRRAVLFTKKQNKKVCIQHIGIITQVRHAHRDLS